jgi:hypothetical protein
MESACPPGTGPASAQWRNGKVMDFDAQAVLKQERSTNMKQTIDSKGLNSTIFSNEEHINGEGSLLEPRCVPTRAEVALLSEHYRTHVTEYESDRGRYPEDGISSRDWNRYVYAGRRLPRLETLLQTTPTYDGMEAE